MFNAYRFPFANLSIIFLSAKENGKKVWEFSFFVVTLHR